MPTMKMSGCAKLITRSTVKASAKPIATTGVGAADDEAVGQLLQQKLHTPFPRFRRVHQEDRLHASLAPISAARPLSTIVAGLEQVGPVRHLQAPGARSARP